MAEHYPITSIEYLLRRETPDSFVTTPVESLTIDKNGIVPLEDIDDKHRGHFVAAGVRNDGFRRRGPEEGRSRVFNHRQISIIDLASLRHIARGLDLDRDFIASEHRETTELFVARHIGANVVVGVVDGDKTLNDLQPPYHLGTFDTNGDFDAAMLVVSYNEPCVRPGKEIGSAYGDGDNEGMGRQFREIARSHRGYVGITSLVGELTVNRQAMIVELPQVPVGVSATT